MFIGIDGSSASLLGRESDADYAAVYRNSYVRQLYTMSGHTNKRYFQGPNFLSAFERDLLTVRNEAIAFIRDVVERSETDRSIVMAGYSRGAAACIAVAREILWQREISRWAAALNVSCLILFDAVSRDVHSDTEVIPTNVQVAFHAIRDPATGSRPLYGNTGTEAATLVSFQPQRFMSSHAGLGGIIQFSDELAEATSAGSAAMEYLLSDQHSLTREEDLAGSAQVRQWMWENAARYVRFETSSLALTSSGPVPRRIAALFSRLREILDDMNAERREAERARMSMDPGTATASRTNLEQATVDVLSGMLTAFPDFDPLESNELDMLTEFSQEDWTDVIETAYRYRFAHTATRWDGDILERHSYEAAISGTSGRLGEVILRRLNRGRGLTAARARAREIDHELADLVRYTDRMYAYSHDGTRHARDLTDGAYIAIRNSTLYIFGITEVKSGRNFEELIGRSGQLARDIVRIREGGVSVMLGPSHFSETFAADSIVFSPGTTDWYLGVPDDEMMGQNLFEDLLREIGISDFRLISLVLNRVSMRAIAGIINDNLPDE